MEKMLPGESILQQQVTNHCWVSKCKKLKYEHIYLTSFSKMRVDLAVQAKCINSVVYLHILQVPSDTVADAMRNTGE